MLQKIRMSLGIKKKEEGMIEWTAEANRTSVVQMRGLNNGCVNLAKHPVVLLGVYTSDMLPGL